MKKRIKTMIIVITYILLLALLTVGLISFISKQAQKYHVFEITPFMCKFLLGIDDPKAFCEEYGQFPSEENGYIYSYAEVDQSGNLIVYMTDEELSAYKHSIYDLQCLSVMLEGKMDIGIDPSLYKDGDDLFLGISDTCKNQISSDFTKIVVPFDGSVFVFPVVLRGCIYMQLFNGVPCEEIRVEYIVYGDAKQEHIKLYYVFPDDVEDAEESETFQ